MGKVIIIIIIIIIIIAAAAAAAAAPTFTHGIYNSIPESNKHTVLLLFCSYSLCCM